MKKEIIEKKLKPIRIYVVKSIKLVTSFMNQLLILKMKKTMNWLEPGLQKITKPEQIAAATGAPAKLSHHEVLLRLDGYDPERGLELLVIVVIS